MPATRCLQLRLRANGLGSYPLLLSPLCWRYLSLSAHMTLLPEPLPSVHAALTRTNVIYQIAPLVVLIAPAPLSMTCDSYA